MSVIQALLASYAPGASGPQFVQQATATAADGSGNVAATFGATLTPGNSVIICISYVSSGTISAAPMLDSSMSSALTQGPTSTIAGVTTEIWYINDFADDDAGSCFYSTNEAVRASINASEWSGLTDFAPVTNSGSGTSNSPSTGSVTPATANNLVVGMYGSTTNAYSSGPVSPLVALTGTGGANGLTGGVTVSGAGTSAVNGIYSERGTANAHPFYNLLGSADDAQTNAISFTDIGGAGEQWVIFDGVGSQYSGDNTSAFPWLVASWANSGGDPNVGGAAPSPTVTEKTGLTYGKTKAMSYNLLLLHRQDNGR